MAASLYVYTFEDGDGNSFGSWSTSDYEEAKGYAMENRYRVIANRYDWADSEVVNDFTPDEDEEE